MFKKSHFVQDFDDVQYLDEYNDTQRSGVTDSEAIDVDIYTSNKENITYNMQKSNAEDGKRMINIKNKTVIVNNMKKHENTILENKHTTMKKMKERSMTETKEEGSNQTNSRNVATQRLEKTLKYTNNLVDLTAEDQQIRKKYYRKKIKLMKKDIEIKERLTIALENISSAYNTT